jgi:hypothetical protein
MKAKEDKQIYKNNGAMIEKKSSVRMKFGLKVGIGVVIAAAVIVSGIFVYKTVLLKDSDKEVNLETTIDKKVVSEQTVGEDFTGKNTVATVQVESPQVTIASEDSTPSIGGTWKRTDVIQADAGSVDITNLNQEGFDFNFFVSHGGNIGEAAGYAIFDGESKAVGTVELWDGGIATFNFIISEGKIEITTENATYIGGMGTFFDGNFIKEDPTYLNENIVEETLGSSKEKVKTLLGDDYDFLVTVMEGGVAYETDLTFSGFVDGVGMGADLKITEDGMIYCLIYELEYRFYTNDPEYQNKVPMEFGELRDTTITYNYKELK